MSTWQGLCAYICSLAVDEGSMCQDRTPGLTAAGAEDDTAINLELPSWAEIVSVKTLHILCVAGKLHLLCSRVSRYGSRENICVIPPGFLGGQTFLPPLLLPRLLPSLPLFLLSFCSETSYTLWINGEVLAADREIRRRCVFCSYRNWFQWVSRFLIHHRYAV